MTQYYNSVIITHIKQFKDMFLYNDRMSLNEVLENIKLKNIQTPDELAVINKWDILMLLVPDLTKEKVKTQKKNYARLKTDNMLYMCIDTICRMFLDMVYLDSRPEMPNDRIGLRSFKHLIKNKLDELEELEEELEKVKEGKGMIAIEEHNSEMDSLRKQIKIQGETIEDLEFKLKEQRKFFEDKMKKQDEFHNSFKKNFTDKLNQELAD